jgi:hypothetical protein
MKKNYRSQEAFYESIQSGKEMMEKREEGTITFTKNSRFCMSNPGESCRTQDIDS